MWEKAKTGVEKTRKKKQKKKKKKKKKMLKNRFR